MVILYHAQYTEFEELISYLRKSVEKDMKAFVEATIIGDFNSLICYIVITKIFYIIVIFSIVTFSLELEARAVYSPVIFTGSE